MLDELCKELNNYFLEETRFGDFQILDGEILPLDSLKEGQFFRIVGSTLNDGVYQHPASNLSDEAFNGAVWLMAVPPSVVSLAAQIAEYNESAQAKPSAYASESFGGYSYARATNKDGLPLGWKDVFASELKRWRKI